MKEINVSKTCQFTKKQLAIAQKLAEGYSNRDIESEGIASRRYVEDMRKKPDFNRYLYSLIEEWEKDTRAEMLLIAKQKVKELMASKTKEKLLDYIDYITKVTGNYAPSRHELEHKYNESDINARFEELLADLGRVQQNAGVIDLRGLRQSN